VITVTIDARHALLTGLFVILIAALWPVFLGFGHIIANPEKYEKLDGQALAVYTGFLLLVVGAFGYVCGGGKGLFI
jgi:hypothetical protein